MDRPRRLRCSMSFWRSGFIETCHRPWLAAGQQEPPFRKLQREITYLSTPAGDLIWLSGVSVVAGPERLRMMTRGELGHDRYSAVELNRCDYDVRTGGESIRACLWDEIRPAGLPSPGPVIERRFTVMAVSDRAGGWFTWCKPSVRDRASRCRARAKAIGAEYFEGASEWKKCRVMRCR